MLKSTLLVIGAFAVLILIGTVLLALPIATNGESLSILDAFFTATSAVCVTGLIVVDTATAFTSFGQVVILLLIQLGGIGIISFSAIILLMLGRRISLIQHDILTTTRLGSELKIDIRHVGKAVLSYVVLLEFAGTILLTFAFLRHFPLDIAVYHAVFQSISAFCNAGFSTFTTSLAAFGGDPFVMLPMMALIILGGLGYVVVLDLDDTLRFGHGITLHTRIVVIATLVLLVFGAVMFFLMENDNVLAGKPVGEKMMVSAFHSVTARTAGFNTVDYYAVSNATLMITILLMFIGGSPGSTAGGIKTTTIAIIFLTAWASVRGKQQPEFMNKSIARRSVNDAVTLTALATMFIFLVAFLLQATELGPSAHNQTGGAFMQLSFETVSAVGTVGLSTGVTGDLSDPGKLIIIVAMFIGRLGPLTFYSLFCSLWRAPRYRLYEESVMVG